MLLPMNAHKLLVFLLPALLSAGTACADLAPSPAKAVAKPKPATGKTPPPPTSQDGDRDPVSVARKDAAVAAQLKTARGSMGPEQAAPGTDETVTTVQLGGQCGFAGCSQTTLVAFTFRTKGANTATQSVLALVTCGPLPKSPCTASPAEVRPTSPPQQAPTPSAPSR